MKYLIFLISLILLVGCAAKKPQQENMDMLGGLMGGSGGSIGTKARGSILAKDAASVAYSNYIDGEVANNERMVNYRASVTLEHAEPEVVIDTVIQRTKAKGGIINKRSDGYISLQIPVKEFKEFFNYILTLGRIVSKEIFATDITDAYTDNAAQLRIAESTLARLQELLASAKTELEKLALLKEIQRISEQIEQRKLREKDLLTKAMFSTINLRVRNEPPVAQPKADIKAFRWFPGILCKCIPDTEPFELEAPKNFVEVKNKNMFKTASALNTEFFAFKTKVNIKGDVNFWMNAIREYFKNEYGTELKPEIIRLQSFNTDSKIYYISILKTSSEETLDIAVAVFRNQESEKKDGEAILEVLRGVK